MERVYICSPYRGMPYVNTAMAKEYCRYAFEQGFLPIAPHLYFPQFMDDNNPPERDVALQMGLSLMTDCKEVWVFGDTVSEGMKLEIEYANRNNKKIIFKNLEDK